MSRLLFAVAFSLLVAFVPAATEEHAALDFGTEREALSGGSPDLASNTNHRVPAWRSGSRLSKNKFFGKALPGFNATAQEPSLFASIKQNSLPLLFSKLDLYEQIKVYRI